MPIALTLPAFTGRRPGHGIRQELDVAALAAPSALGNALERHVREFDAVALFSISTARWLAEPLPEEP